MRTALLAFLAMAQASVAFAQTAPAADPAITTRLDAVIDRAIAEKRLVGTVVLVSRDGQVIYRRAAGLADREKGVPMKEDTVFRLASVTKPIVTTAAMRLIEQGKLKLDDPVTRWLPYFQPRLPDGTAPVITVRQLLNHTSGLSYRLGEPAGSIYHKLDILDGMEQPGPSLDDNLKRLSQAPLAFKPGSAWRYSLSIDVLGAVIERAAGEPLPQAVKTLVTGPLGMKDTAFVAKDPARLAVPYMDGKPEPVRMYDGIKVPVFDNFVTFAPSRALDPTAFPSGGAGMVGTAKDVLTLLETIRTGGAPVLKKETVAQMVSDQVGTQAQTQGPGWGFGYGWAVLVEPDKANTPQSKGTFQWGGVYGHSWFVDPEQKISVVALTNTTIEGMAGPFVTEVRDAVYGAKPNKTAQ